MTHDPRYGREISRVLLLAVCGAWLVVRSRTTYSLDRVLFEDDKEQV